MTNVHAIELFSARVCPYAHRTRLVLSEKGLDCALTEIDFKNKPQRFLEISRYGKVPARSVSNPQLVKELQTATGQGILFAFDHE